VFIGGLLDHPIAKSIDGGLNWQFEPSAAVFNPLDIAVSPVDSNLVWASGAGDGVWRTTNGGGHWAAHNNGITDTLIEQVAPSPTNAQVAYAAASNGGGVFKTKDEGASWSSKNNGLTDHHVDAIAIDPADSNHLLAGTQTGVFESTDGAKTWTPKTVGLPASPFIESLSFDPSDTQIVYLTTLEGGVFRSIDGSDTWSDFSTGLPVDAASRDIHEVEVAADGSVAYAATSAGVYVRPV
jgi:photosystem II stability/assembly factor-like uncharacterized protein